MRRACLASVLLLLAAPAFAQPVTPIPPRNTKRPHAAVPKPTAADLDHNPGGVIVAPAAPGGDARPIPQHQEGDYGGVTPGETPKTEHPRPKRTPPKGTLSWIGFEAKTGGAELFFQSIAPFEITQAVENGTLVVHLGDLRTLGANTWRAVDTRFFDNPLARVEAKHVGAARAGKGMAAHGAGLEVRVTFKNPKDAREGTTRSGQEADGYFYQYLTFPEGADSKGQPVSEPER